MPGAEILLVEDDQLNQALVPAILARSQEALLRDAHVIAAGTLARARAVLATHQVDLVLLDVLLPDGSGLSLASELRGQEAAVIALTGAPTEHGEAALAAGCAAVLGKPYRPDQLRQIIAAHLRHGQPGEAGPAAAAAPAPAGDRMGPPAQFSGATKEYVARISHELRTPINTILGFGELLSLADLAAEHREWVSMMVKAARRLASFMDDVADISWAQEHRLSLSIEPVGVGKVIADALELVHPLALSHGVHLDPPPPTGEHVLADERRLRQVLLNLLSNAIKYNHPAGKVAVTIAPRPPGGLRISIADTGRGIAGHDLSRLFTPFQRLDAAQAGVEGAGLGLTLSRQLVEAMGGTIGAASAAGQGSEFWVELPAAEPAAEPAAAETGGGDPLVAPRAYAAPKIVLYVEDMLESLQLVEQVLTQRPSVALVPAMLGGVALDLAAEHRPHLILLDLDLPDIPGEELLRRLKADPATGATPIAIISADAAPERISSLLGMGAAAYLTKPIGVRDFLRTVDALLTNGRVTP